MAFLVPLRAMRSWTSRASRITRSRYLSTSQRLTSPLCLSLPLSAQDIVNTDALFEKLKTEPSIAATHSDDAAVIFGTPELARSFSDQRFMSRLAQSLAPSDSTDFHVLGAIVDHVAPLIGSYETFPALSVLRGRRDTILPNLWQRAPPKSREDTDTMAAVTLEARAARVTVPLANTTFHNEKPSTLFAARFDLGRRHALMVQHAESHSLRVNLLPALAGTARPFSDLWVPLSPITEARKVTESFGNIVKGVEVNGVSTPASTELEGAIELLYQRPEAIGTPPRPMGVWALVCPTPPDEGGLETRILSDAGGQTTDEINATARYIKNAYENGGRLYQILSGGGGWGAKKGLLSLDPQRSHFALSEEEEMQRFMRAMEGSDFTPVGSTIQFLTTAEPPQRRTPEPGIVFGVPAAPELSKKPRKVNMTGVVEGHFGALSAKGIFVSSGDADDTKLNVPNSRVYL